METKSIENYRTNWDYRRENADYHFDPSQKDELRDDIVFNWIQFSGDWNGDLASFQPDMRPPTNLDSRLIRNSVQECLDLGLNYVWTLGERSEVTAEKYPTLAKMVRTLKLRNPLAAIHCQKPGMVSWLHMDVLCSFHEERSSDKNGKELVRLFIALSDWQAGHFFSLGNRVWHQWKAGDSCWYDWQNIPHSTANAGLSPRYTLKVTGERTAEFDLLLQKRNEVVRL